MNIILSFLIGAIILYIIVGSFIGFIEEGGIDAVPKYFRLGAKIGFTIICLAIFGIIIYACYLLGSKILNILI